MASATVSTRLYTNEHVTIRSPKPFADTQAKLHSLVPRIDDGIFTLLRYGEADRRRSASRSRPTGGAGSRGVLKSGRREWPGTVHSAAEPARRPASPLL